MKIGIERSDEGLFTVKNHGRIAANLSWEEMLGLVASLSMPAPGICLSWLITEAEHQAFLDRQRAAQAAALERLVPEPAKEKLCLKCNEPVDTTSGHAITADGVLHSRCYADRVAAAEAAKVDEEPAEAATP